MEKRNFKKNKGLTTADVVVAISILTLFVGVIGNLYYQLAQKSYMVRFNTIAVYYSIKVAEDIDKMPYEEVSDNLNTTIKETYQLPEGINIVVEVHNYNETQYQYWNDTNEYQIKKLKVKEM